MPLYILYLTMMLKFDFYYLKKYVPNEFYPYIISTATIIARLFMAISIYVNYYFLLYTGLNPIIFLAFLIFLTSNFAKSAVIIQGETNIHHVIYNQFFLYF